ncbi:hypothetical protein XENOCAPTIV_026770 [Xenoophorus captivus]|uniref:Spore coat protein n=1 Tax=Xenoophorus captivus TaxID=1517983 RepID=A0ABV0RVW2_9TELE
MRHKQDQCCYGVALSPVTATILITDGAFIFFINNQPCDMHANIINQCTCSCHTQPLVFSTRSQTVNYPMLGCDLFTISDNNVSNVLVETLNLSFCDLCVC